VDHILAYLPLLDRAVRTNGKSGRVCGNNIDFSGGELISALIDEKAVTDLYLVFVLCSYLLRVCHL
jgi:hypothetical protein